MLDLSKIKQQLPHGAQTKIAKQAKVHLNVVHRVLKGESENISVLIAIADFLKKHKKEKSEVLNTIYSLID